MLIGMIANVDGVARGHGIDHNVPRNDIAQLLNCPQLMEQFSLKQVLQLNIKVKVIKGQTIAELELTFKS